MICLILLLRSMPQSDFFLIIEPRLIMGPDANVNHPLHKTRLYPGCILLVFLTVRGKKPFHKVRLRTNYGSPGINHLLGVTNENLLMSAEHLCVFGIPSNRLLDCSQFLERHRRVSHCRTAIFVTGNSGVL